MHISIRCSLSLVLMIGSGARGQTQLDGRYWQQPPGTYPLDPSYLPSLAREAVEESRRFIDDAYNELSATYPGQQVIVRGQAMVQQGQSLQAQLDRFGPGGQNIRSEAARFDAAVGGARAALNDAGGSYAPATSRSLRRVERLSRDIQNLADGGAYYPPTPPAGSGIDRPRFRSIAQQTAVDANEAATVLYDSGWNRSYPYDRVVRQLDSMSGGLQQLTALVDRRAPDGQLGDGLRAVQSIAEQVDHLVGAGQASYPPPPSFMASWDRARRGVDRLVRVGDGGGDPGLPPIQPPIQPPIRPPVFPPVRPPRPIVPPIDPGHGGPVALIDQMTPDLDQFVATLRANVNAVPNAIQFIRQGQNLQSLLAQIRRGLLAGQGGPRLQGKLAEADNVQRRLLEGIRKVAGNRGGPNIDRMRRVGERFEQLKATLLN